MADGRYTKVRALFWSETAGWSDDEKLLAMYLKTTRHSNALGCYALPAGYACEDLGWSPERFRELFEELLAKQFLHYDPATRMVLIPGHLRDNTIENPNQVKAALRALADLPDTPLLARLADELTAQGRDFLQPLIVELRIRVKQLGKLLPKPLPEQLGERFAKPNPACAFPNPNPNTNPNPNPGCADARDEGGPPAGGEEEGGGIASQEGQEEEEEPIVEEVSAGNEAVCIKHEGVMTPITEVPGDRLTYLVNNGKSPMLRQQCATELSRREEGLQAKRRRGGPVHTAAPPPVGESPEDYRTRVKLIRHEKGWDKETPPEDHGFTPIGTTIKKAMKGDTK